MKKTAAESHRILMEVYGKHALAERTCQKWFARFKDGDFCLEDEERPRQPKKFEDEELEALIDEDCCQTQKELAESLRVTQAAISKRLKAAGYIQSKNINGKAEYPWREGNALYLVGSEWCAVLRE
ncbi:unnamed protein product [Euphydryas editha]|uniref:Mos1 transposase HTH domain-containing protein n=1 Tax=Euphydryas editha TaxID=104508 RepID=A0AAU9URY9_EUPED|nr:unnamed protein product [Euphydryas editha]